MAKVRGTSNAPMVLGLIGGILELPGALLGGACAAGCASLTATSSSSINAAGNTFLVLGLIAAVLAIVFACLSKKSPILSGIMLLVSAVLTCITLFVFNFLSLIVAILLIIAGIICLAQKKETVE